MLTLDRVETYLIRFAQGTVLLPQFSEVARTHFFQAQGSILRILSGSNQLIDFQMQNIVVTVLCILNQENHKERNNGGRGVYDQLPRIVVVKKRASESPHDDQYNGSTKGFRTPSPVRK